MNSPAVAVDCSDSGPIALLVDGENRRTQEGASPARACPRCGRPVQRRPQAKWCSDTCKARAYEKRREERANASGDNQIPTQPSESKETVTVTGSTRLWERSSTEPEKGHSTIGNGAGTTEAAVAAVRQALSRRLRMGAEDAILRRVQSLLTRRPR